MSRQLLVLGGLLMLVGCSQSDQWPEAAPEIPPLSASASSSLQSSAKVAEKPVYGSYRDGVIGQGNQIALFFYDPDELFSKQTEESIKKLYASGSLKIPTYRVHYNLEKEVKRRFAIVNEDTLLLLDAEGKVMKTLIHPTGEELKSFYRQTNTSSQSSIHSISLRS